MRTLPRFSVRLGGWTQTGYCYLGRHVCQSYANMRLPHISLIAEFFAYIRKVRISHIFSHKLAFFDGNFNIICVLLPTSIRVRYLNHLVANSCRMHHPRVRTPVERDGVVGFKQFCTVFPHISAAYLVFLRSAYFFKVPHKTDTRIPRT